MIASLVAAAITGAFGLTWGQTPTEVAPVLTHAGYVRKVKVGCGLEVYEGTVRVGDQVFKRGGLVPWYDPGGKLTMVEARVMPDTSIPRAFTALAKFFLSEYDAPASFAFYALDARHQKTGAPIDATTADLSVIEKHFAAGKLTAQGKVHLPGRGVLASGAGVFLRVPKDGRYLSVYYVAAVDLAEELVALCEDAI